MQRLHLFCDAIHDNINKTNLKLNSMTYDPGRQYSQIAFDSFIFLSDVEDFIFCE